ncbi:hypothetical protein E2C01_013583 [Portunus trituberculatus]|uniref:Uncharacterized protein n=1 Tax=Portunus trituberculatus TaxID=210409 RepID=A0A5B7DH16_PORTR|nr:hypothetical protein [Portunus trituberculatus]
MCHPLLLLQPGAQRDELPLSASFPLAYLSHATPPRTLSSTYPTVGTGRRKHKAQRHEEGVRKKYT